jgi:hypothetical protein
MAWKVRAYYNVNPFIGFNWHDTMVTVPVPPFMIPGKFIHYDFSVVQGLWLGSFLSNGRDRTVVSDDLLFVGRMSDAGFFLPHFSIPPSWYNLLTTLFGSSNALFGVGSVTVACKNLLWGNDDCDLATSMFPVAPVSLNLQCGDPMSLPTDLVVVWGTVYAGMDLADLYAALIDLAIQWAMEGVMFFGGKALTAGLKKLGKGAAKGATKAASKKAASGVKKGIFAATGDKIVSAFKKATGATASDAYKEYLKKAARCAGIKDALAMSDDDLAKFVKQTGGFSDELGEVAEEFSSGYSKFGSKYGKQSGNLNKVAASAGGEVTNAIYNLKKLDGFVSDDMASLAVKNTMLKEALGELDDVIAKVAAEEVVFSAQLKLTMKSLSKFVYGHVIRSANVFGDGTEGGLFSFEGTGWTNYFQRTLQFDQKWYDYSVDKFEEVDDEYWDGAYVDGGDLDVTDEDYWYDSGSEDADQVGSADDDEDDDYWYGGDSSGTAASTGG